MRSRGGHPGPLLSAFVDDSLSARARRRVTAHLAGCAVCRHDLAQLRAAKRLVRGLGGLTPPQRWVEELAASPPSSDPVRVPNLGVRRRLLRRVTLGASAVFALLLAGALLAPPPEIPLDYEQLLRSHLVQVGEPSSDQGSYIVTVDNP